MDIPDVPVCGSDDEIGDLTRTFNRMKDDCRSLLTAQQEKEELTRELYEERLSHIAAENQLSAAHLAMLKQQINPHFLFNTLTLISQTAQQENAGETGRLIQQLSILLRHNLYDRQDRVTIRQELETLYSYMYIQESRFLDRVGCNGSAGNAVHFGGVCRHNGLGDLAYGRVRDSVGLLVVHNLHLGDIVSIHCHLHIKVTAHAAVAYAQVLAFSQSYIHAAS
jgi:hypothetical protein